MAIPGLNRCPFKWQCPVSIHSWFLLRLSSSPALFATGFLRKPLAYLCPYMDCQCSSCFLLVQSLITPLATFADIPSSGLGPITGCQEPFLANSSAVLFPSIPMCPVIHSSWILLSSASFTRDWWQSQTKLEFIWKLSRALMASWLLERIWMFLPLYPMSVFFIIQAFMAYLAAWNTIMWSQILKLYPWTRCKMSPDLMCLKIHCYHMIPSVTVLLCELYTVLKQDLTWINLKTHEILKYCCARKFVIMPCSSDVWILLFVAQISQHWNRKCGLIIHNMALLCRAH